MVPIPIVALSAALLPVPPCLPTHDLTWGAWPLFSCTCQSCVATNTTQEGQDFHVQQKSKQTLHLEFRL